MSTLRQDLRYAIRMLWKSAAVSAVAIVTLALGIGATTAVFSVVNGVLLRPLPYYESDRLMLLWGNTVRNGVVERRGASYPDFRDWRDQSKSFEGTAFISDSGFSLNDVGEAERIQGEYVSATYFDLLGMRPVLGRAFTANEDAPTGSALVAVISHGLWQRRFGSDRSVLGRALQLNKKTYTIVGVAPPAFRGITDAADVWLPTGGFAPSDLAGRGDRGPQVIGRLRPGVSVQQAQAELTNICLALAKLYPKTNDQRGVEVIGLKEDTFAQIRRPVLVTLGAVLLVFLIACVNISNLLLARAEGRQREVAIRFALGATRARVLRQLLTESAVLAVIGAGCGLVLGTWAVPGLLALNPIQLPSFVNVQLDRTVLAFTAGLGIATALLVGVLPGFHFWRRELHSMLTSAGGRTGQTATRKGVRAALVITEVALAMMLLTGAGLLIRSFQRLTALDPGFESGGMLTMRLQLGGAQDPNSKIANRALALVDNLKSAPGVTAVSLSSDLPLAGGGSAVFYTPEGNTTVTEGKRPRAYIHRVSPEFFSTLQIPLRQGRFFTANEMSSDARLIIVSSDVVKRYWSNDNPIGKRLKMGAPDSQNPWYEVVGVVGDVKYRALPRNPTPDPDLYFPLHERSEVFALALRTNAKDPAQLSASIRARVKQYDAAMPVYNIASMDELIGQQLAATRFARSLMAGFAGLALLLALVGTYSVMSYLVAQRTHELGIRMALGARPRDIFTGVVTQGLLLGAFGAGVGVLGALLLRKALGDLLYEVSATNPAVIATVAVLSIAATTLACYIPARTATKVDPMVALRNE